MFPRLRKILPANGRLSRYYHSDNGVYGHLQIKDGLIPKFIEIGSKDGNKNAAGNMVRLADAFRAHGHRIAQIDPLSANPPPEEIPPELRSQRYDLPASATTEGLFLTEKGEMASEEVVSFLKEVYSDKVGYEFMYIEDEAERTWFAERIEALSYEKVPDAYRIEIALEMARSQNFDHFLAKKFQTVKRYGGEGAESMVAFFQELLKASPNSGIDHIVVGMAHRGRLNLLTGLLKYSPVKMFQKMKGLPEFPPEARASGDVLSHLFTSVDLESPSGGTVHVSLLPNPSHLEAVNPMAVGKARGKLKSLGSYDYEVTQGSGLKIEKPSRVLCVQVHGDAALIGQGINQETLGFAYVPHFRVGGSVHLVINNQLGYTTPADRAKSSRYTTDIAKMISAPVIHVNGDCPEDLVKATRLALEYRSKFHKDVFIDLVCFRRWGHNELDDPTFTNPLIYEKITSRPSIPDKYAEALKKEGVLTEETLSKAIQEHSNYLQQNLDKIETYTPESDYLQGHWKGLKQGGEEISSWDTGIDVSLLKYVGAKSVEHPSDFNVHSHLSKTFIKHRVSRITEGNRIDWATAEALAFGTLLYQGFGVRLSGEDVGRGTFSQRHAMLVDQKSGNIFIPLNSLVEDQAEKLEVCNSTLSEEAVLGFEYGFSLEHPNYLCVWEAQFGDFFNGAQIIIDTLITSGETKWMLQSGQVMLLPHGMDGAGPEHSSCRIERFLQLTDSNEDGKVDGDYNNFEVVNPTTPAQYFHLLRRQVLRNYRKPLIVIGPKVLLRLPAASSQLEEMGPGTFFQPVLDDTTASPKAVKKLIFVSGKLYYALKEKQLELKKEDIAIVRVESLCPFPVLNLQKIMKKYEKATEFAWVQEEHQNMGAWSFVRPRFENFLGTRLRYIGRGPLATPAVGVGRVHQQQVQQLMKEALS